jgi:hypothetical protein
MNKEPFKVCPNCNALWETMEAFLSDPELKMNGYQVHFDDLEGGLFFFTHLQEECFTTLAIPVTQFLSLNDQPLLEKRDKQRCTGSDLCVHQGDLLPKPVECECLWVREILQTIKAWPKTA